MIRDSFNDYHPLVNITYFLLVFGFSLMIIHPVTQAISLICAIFYAVTAEGKKTLMFHLKFCLPTVLITAFINPAFNHEGLTILLYFSNGNPLTAESICYGFSAGILIITTIIWFSSFNRIMTSDKFIYLFGKIIPALSLVLSMSLRFVPKFKSQLKLVSESQKCIGRDISEGSIFQRAKTAITILSIMITWSLENAIETADSMKSRGYGLKGRSAFSIFRFSDRDKLTLVWIIFCGLFVISGEIIDVFAFRFFPDMRFGGFTPFSMIFYVMYFGLLITPVVLNYKEEKNWKTLYSKM